MEEKGLPKGQNIKIFLPEDMAAMQQGWMTIFLFSLKVEAYFQY